MNPRLLTATLMAFGLLFGAACAASNDLAGTAHGATGAEDNAIGAAVADTGGSDLTGKGKGKKPTATPTAVVDPTATPEPTATQEPCTSCPQMYVDVVNVNAWSQSRTVGAGCLVRIRDTAGSPVASAIVTIQWSGIHSGIDSGETIVQSDGDTYARILTPTLGHRCNRQGPAVFTCSVTDVEKDGHEYAPALNLETTDSEDACS